MNSNVDLMSHVDEVLQPAQEAARASARAGVSEIRNLIADVEDLIKRVAHFDDADLARARAKLERTLASARASPHNGSERVRASASEWNRDRETLRQVLAARGAADGEEQS